MDRVTLHLQKLPALKIAYEEPLYEHAASVRRVLHFLLGSRAAARRRCRRRAGATAGQHDVPQGRPTGCEAVSNRPACAKYRVGPRILHRAVQHAVPRCRPDGIGI